MEQQPKMHSEKTPEFDLGKEIRNGLSQTWFKSIQEILPGVLRNAPKSELSEDEIALYSTAYKELSKMVEEGIVEKDLREDETEFYDDGAIKTRKNTMTFKWKTDKGTEEPKINFSTAGMRPAHDTLH